MELFTLQPPVDLSSLGIALVVSSSTPLVLLDSHLTVKAASGTFCREFGLNPNSVVGVNLLDLGNGEWNVPQLQSLLNTTVKTDASFDAYEMDLVRNGHATCRLVLNAHSLDYDDANEMLIVLAVQDVSAARKAEQVKDNLIREKDVLHHELQHRIANSLQIIASVLMQSARRVHSEETRVHLRDAHHRVLSVAALQKQLATTNLERVALRPYFSDLCDSIGASMISDPARITLTSTVDETVTDPDVSVSLGLIVTELVINALKHAFPSRTQNGTITVDYKSDGRDWALHVCDDGIGMPSDMSEIKPGLGTGIVEALSSQLKADYDVRPGSPGTIVSIVAKAANKRKAA